MRLKYRLAVIIVNLCSLAGCLTLTLHLSGSTWVPKWCAAQRQSAEARRGSTEEATSLDAYPRATQEQLCARAGFCACKLGLDYTDCGNCRALWLAWCSGTSSLC